MSQQKSFRNRTMKSETEGTLKSLFSKEHPQNPLRKQTQTVLTHEGVGMVTYSLQLLYLPLHTGDQGHHLLCVKMYSFVQQILGGLLCASLFQGTTHQVPHEVFIKQLKVKVLVLSRVQLLFDSMDCSPPGSPVHGILQARIILEWVAIPSYRGSSQPRDQTRDSCIAGRFFPDCWHNYRMLREVGIYWREHQQESQNQGWEPSFYKMVLSKDKQIENMI